MRKVALLAGVVAIQGCTPFTSTCAVSHEAHWNWDVAYYLIEAGIVARRGGEVVGRGVDHLKNKGGLGKFTSTERKINPVLDRLLADFKRT